jgi:ATP-dependent DNA helicase RecQ
VFRVDQRFGAEYVAQVLTGSKDKRILQNRHDQVSTYGLLNSDSKNSVRTWIEQLVSQDYLAKTGEFNVLTISDKGRKLLRGESIPRLTKPAEPSSSPTPTKNTASWEGVDIDLFEKLRLVRGSEAQKRQVPAYVVFSDAALRDMARRRPSTLDAFRLVNGVGKQKLADYGEMFLELIKSHCEKTGLSIDVKPESKPANRGTDVPQPPTKSAAASFQHFDDGSTVEEVAQQLGRAASTVKGYLSEYIRHRKITDPSRWVDLETVAQVQGAIQQAGIGPLKPVFVMLDEKISYDEIRIVMECLKNEANSAS